MRSLTAADRSAILYKAHGLMIERAGTFGRTVSSESGKPLREGLLEAERAAQTLLFSAEEAHRLAGEVIPMDLQPHGERRWGLTRRFPLSPITAITPFNSPLNTVAHKIAPAFAAGHSLGEYSAHVAAGTMTFADALRTVRRRGPDVYSRGRLSAAAYFSGANKSLDGTSMAASFSPEGARRITRARGSIDCWPITASSPCRNAG